MKTTFELDSADLKAAIEAWMNARGTPVTDADAFSVDASGTVTITVTSTPAAPIPLVPGPTIVPGPTGVINIPGAPVPVTIPPVAPLPGHMVVSDPPWSATGIDTEFGYRDSSDNGIGFFTDPATGKPYNTDNTTLVGISLPREVLMSTFGITDDWRSKPTLEIWNAHANAVQDFARIHKITANVDGGGKSLRGIPLVDAGPSRRTNNLVDLTEAAAEQLCTGGKAFCTFELLKDGVPMELKGIDFVKGIVA